MIGVLHGGGGYAQKITILHRGGGVYRDPQNALRNLWTAPKLKLTFWLNIDLVTGFF